MKFSLKLFGGTVVGLLLAVSALAQTFPAKPVTLMVPYPAGGVSDVIARTLNVTLSKHLGQPVIVENLGGRVAPLRRKRYSMHLPTATSFFKGAPTN
jgi:tripartite-type tricarboxylate transporter receptor subunit TctC